MRPIIQASVFYKISLRPHACRDGKWKEFISSDFSVDDSLMMIIKITLFEKQEIQYLLIVSVWIKTTEITHKKKYKSYCKQILNWIVWHDILKKYF